MFILPAVVIFFAVICIMFGAWLIFPKIKSGRLNRGTFRSKNEEDRLKQANKRLEKNPNDPEALSYIGEVFYKKGAWEQVLDVYRRLSGLPSGTRGVDEVAVNVRAAEACVKLGQTEDAYKYLVVARALDNNNFEVCYQLGSLEFLRKNYEKAVQILQQVRNMRPEYAPAVRTLGHALFRLKKTREAMQYIRQSIDMAPNDKESLITLAQCYCEANQNEQALRIYQHLRPDPVWGAEACLASGRINAEGRQDTEAISDFEIGLKHKDIPQDTEIELHYQLANAYIRTQNIGKALPHLNEVASKKEDYKDTSELIVRYQELCVNQNLQLYTIAPSADFMGLCRRIVLSYFPKARVKIARALMQANDWADIVAEVDTPKWSDVVMFRFIRTQGSIGELVVRDFHSHLKEAKAGKGICMGVGTYSDESKRFTEARLIDLIDKPRLTAILNNLDMKQPSA